MPDLATSSSAQTSSPDAPTPKPNVLGLSTAQVVGSALAAATSALAASFLGVAGTIIGAVVGSLVATIASAVYAHSLRHAGTRIREVRPVLVTRHADTRAHVVRGPETAVMPGAAADVQPAGTQPVDAKPADANRADAQLSVDRPRRIGSIPRWAGVAAGVVAGAVVALGGITGVEALLGHPVSNSSAKGTTLSTALGGSNAASENALSEKTTSKKGPRNPSADTSVTTPGASTTATPGASPTDTATAPPAGQPQPTGTPTESAPPTTGPTDQGPAVQPTGPATSEAPAPSQSAPSQSAP